MASDRKSLLERTTTKNFMKCILLMEHDRYVRTTCLRCAMSHINPIYTEARIFAIVHAASAQNLYRLQLAMKTMC